MKLTAMLSIACLALSLAGCHRLKPLTQQEKQTVSEITTHLGSRCVGRYLIDMPRDVLSFGTAKVQGVTLEAKAMEQEEYRHEIDARRQELKAIKHIKGYQFLYADGEARGEGTHYFVHLKNEYGGNIGRVIEGYKWSNGFRVKLQTTGHDVTTSVEKDNPAAQNIGSNVREKTQLVFDLMKRVQGRPEDDIPTEPGFCFLGGFLPGTASSGEEVSSSFVLHDKQDVNFKLRSDTDLWQSNSLLQRGKEIKVALDSTDGGRTIRNGTVDIHGMRAEEWLAAGQSPLGVPGHFLTLEVNGMTASAQTPLLILDMRNGWLPPNYKWEEKPAKASLSESEVVALWDAISRTLRPRPNSF